MLESRSDGLPPGLSEENRLGPYRLLRKLGEGGMGTVYLGHDDLLDRRVAVKVLRGVGKGARDGAEGGVDATMARRFLREAKSAARISHPHVVTIYTVGQQAGRPYLVMEYVEGGSLADQVRKAGPMGWREATAAVRDALQALVAAHGKGVIHRDVKPANLMRGRDGQGREVIKLVDFGLARVVAGPSGGEGELTFAGAFVGSPSYASPEQIAGAALMDGRADLYSLAATWYALLTGQPPFVAEDPAEIMERHLGEPFPEVGALARVPRELVEVLGRASRKRPEERYAGAMEMLGAVEGLLALPGDVGVGRGRKAAKGRGGSAADSEAACLGTPTPKHGTRVDPGRETPSVGSSSGGGAGDEETVAELETTLARARACRDSSTQLQALRRLYGLYARLERREEAVRAFREALVVHVKMHAPGAN